MKNSAELAIFDSYCYGPADLITIRKGDSTLWLSLRDSEGKTAQAIYRSCVYWRLDESRTGLHLSLVRRVSAEELMKHPGSETLLALQKNTDDVGKLLKEWEAAGLSFYLHLGTDTEFLVAARSLDYHETN